MKSPNMTFLAQFASREMAADAAYVLGWIDDLVAAGIAQFDADEILACSCSPESYSFSGTRRS
jgi:hypothetical protein